MKLNSYRIREETMGKLKNTQAEDNLKGKFIKTYPYKLRMIKTIHK